MSGQWRWFRHEAGRVAGPPPWAYVVLFVASLAVGFWSARTFGAVAVWLSNGIMAAALLQLHRRQAVAVIALCFAANLANNVLRGDPGIFLWLNAVLNLGVAWITAILARRVCGAALDMRRPGRLARFAFLAALPAVLASAVIALGLMYARNPIPLPRLLFFIQTYVSVELLGVLLITPALLMFARVHRFEGTSRASPWEATGLFALMVVVTGLVFWQTQAPLLFLPFLPLILIALRLSPPAAAASMLVMAVISGFLTLTGHGPVQLTELSLDPALQAVPSVLRRLIVFNVFVLAAIVAVLPISTVITERRRLVARLRARTLVAQEARRRAEHAAQARSRFLAMMSHEMRTPLNGVAGFADLLAARPDLAPEAVRQARQIRQSSDGLLTLVEDILDFARGDDAVVLAPEALSAVLEEASAPSLAAAQAKGLTLDIQDRLPALSRFHTDRRALRQALQPLIANAVKFTDRGGVTLTLEPVGDGVSIRIADTGRGLDAEVRARLFQAFEQGDATIARDHDGAGLGLALAARHVRRLGGSIAAGDAPGLGAVFTLTLPMARAADADPTPVEPAPAEEAGRAPVVLVVDDHPVNREVARIMLEAFGCEVVEAHDGAQAVDAVGLQGFDLVLMDVRMPGMDGLEATRRIRALIHAGLAVGDLPIVAMTADAMPEDVARCLAAGMNAHMAKPVSQAGLLTMVNRALSGEFAQSEAVAA